MLSPALGIGAFAEKTLVAAGQCTKVDPAAPADGRRPARLRRDGRHRRGDQHRRGRRGATRSRCSAAAASATRPSPGARLAGAATIIAVDIDDRKLEWAKEFGATHTVNSATDDPVESIRALTGGFGADVCIEAVGNPSVYQQAFEARDLAGTVVLVGVPDPTMTLELPLIEVFGRGGALKSSWYGDCLPTRDFPMLIDLYLQGRLDLDRFVSETIALDEVEEAFHKMERGEVLRSRRGAVSAAWRIEAGHDRRHVRARRRRVGGHQQHLAGRRRPRGGRDRRRPRHRPIVDAVGGRRCGRSC